MTSKGLFRYRRLMFGINCAPEIFQKIMEQVLSGCDGCMNYIDDIIVYGSTIEQHDQRLRKVLKRLSAYNVMLNSDKCMYRVKSLEFLGHRLSSKGIEPSEDKCLAIKQFRQPMTSEEVRSFLGLVNYVGKFIPNLSTLTNSLRELTKQAISFEWTDEHARAFEEIKQQMSKPNVLGYYDVNDRTRVIADASPVGLGAVLIQYNDQNEPRIIAFASRGLTDVEKRYAQTEKEALALVWSIERFHHYVYGRSFELVTDHKPLETIFGQHSRPCARIERWVLRLQSYKYKVIYKPGKSNIADPLSRLACPVSAVEENLCSQATEYVNWIVAKAEPKAVKINEIESESAKDPAICAMRKALYENTWDDLTAPYKAFETEFCFRDNILLRGTRIVMPASLWERMLELAHEGHPGISVMKRRLRAKVWWPKIDQAVENFVKKCFGCTITSAPDRPEPMKRTELPNDTWQHVAMDYCGVLPSGHHMLVVVDYFSRFIEVEFVKTINSEETIDQIDTMFARCGYPLSITADNARQFISQEFKEYCEQTNIRLISTIPYWPQMNGEVERQNRSLLKRLIIMQNEKKKWRRELNKYLLMYRSTKHSITLKSPGELMFGRCIRDKLPSIWQPAEVDEELRDRDKEQKVKGKEYSDAKRKAEPS